MEQTSDSFTARQGSIREKTFDILKRFPRARDDDRLLIQLFHYHHDGLKRFISFEDLRRLTPPESIVRARRFIQNKRGLYPPSKPRRRGRRRETEKFRRFYKSGE